MRTKRFGAFLLASSLALTSGCTNKRAGEDEESESTVPALVTVKVAPIVRSDVDVAVTATGKTDALNKVKVVSPIAGRIQSLNAVEGNIVKNGDVLATIQSREAHAAIAGAEALLQSAQTPEEKAEAERTLKLAQSTQNAVKVYARLNGSVATRSVNAGEFVAENAELMTLVDLSTIVFVADLQLRDVPSVRAGQVCNVQFPSLPGRAFRARLDAIYPQSSEQSQTVKARIRFLDPIKEQRAFLRTEMAGVAGIIIGHHNGALIVPRAAVLRNDETGTHSVVLMTADSLARSVPVNVGVTSDSTAEVMSPDLRPGMEVIVEGNYALADSTRVTVATAEPR